MSGADTTRHVNDGYTREDVPCIICGVKDEEFQFNTPERLVKCRRCGLFYNNPRLDLEGRKKIYSKEYFVIDHDDPGTDFKAYSNYIAEEPLIIKSVTRRIKKLESFTRSKGRMLDVGCAAGFSLIAAQRRGWKAEGIEFSSFCVDYAHSRGLAVHHGTLYDFPGEKTSLDAITMWDYLEHSPNPLNDLIICHSLLKPGGVVMLSIPNVDSWSYRLLKQNWIGFKNIDHLYFFSRNSLAKLASVAGFTLESSFYHGRDVALSFFLARMQYYTKFKPLLRAIDKIANTPSIKRISFYMNPYDILNGVLRKV
jgi:SAM-dependent methyltransferase